MNWKVINTEVNTYTGIDFYHLMFYAKSTETTMFYPKIYSV